MEFLNVQSYRGVTNGAFLAHPVFSSHAEPDMYRRIRFAVGKLD